MAKKKATAAAVDGLFGGKAAQTKSKGKSAKVRAEVDLPKELRQVADIAMAYKVIKDDLKKKGELAEKRVKAHLLQWWCEQFAETGKRPDMCNCSGNESTFQYTMTRRITVTAEKQEALEMIGADLSEYIETSGIEIDMDAVKTLGYMDDLQEAIQNLVGGHKMCPKCDTKMGNVKFCSQCGADLSKVKVKDGASEHVGQIFRPKVTAKDGIMEALPGIAEECEADGELAEKIQAIMEILKPVPQVKKADLGGKDPDECFALINETSMATLQGKG